ncbi:hypothetical protein ZIOFF_008356 [Zingiber officinale]|uniref:Protein kinase domain-containing protein n=1 Tax=Zingiber officinale TaxID=94328 RepID=A0A8J5II44_ZINOF|nr:hypothetical protein ZIOFF_008356 [Zingiber officinale]
MTGPASRQNVYWEKRPIDWWASSPTGRPISCSTSTCPTGAWGRCCTAARERTLGGRRGGASRRIALRSSSTATSSPTTSFLDSNFEAHVADFGLAKFLHDTGASECVSSIAGSYGYIAPDSRTEYAYTLRADEKSDVYSFGVVLLELITGQRPVGGFGDGVDIVRWVRKTISEANEESDAAAVMSIVDGRLTPSPETLITNLFKVAMLCLEEQSTATGRR